jgi:hypothetical protein
MFSTLAAILILFICYKQKINFPLVNPFLLIKASRIEGQEISLAPKVSAVLNFRRQLDGGPCVFFPGKGETIWGPFFQRNVVLLGCKFPSGQFSESLGVLVEVGY